MHVTNGDSTVMSLRETMPGDEIIAWRDALHEGPVPDVPPAELRRIRAGFLGADVEELAARDRALTAHDEYVLWFEADLYDQLQLIQILAMLEVPTERITLICIGEYPGIAHFGGLGELDAEQLGGLSGAPLTEAALDYARRAWDVFRAPEPTGLGAIAPNAELRFVAEAFDRLAREYPSTRDGLSLTERRILAAVAAGAETAGDVFVRAGARETRPFLGDTWCFDRINRLAGAQHPLLSTSPLRLTDAGRRVLDGDADHVALNGIDRWIGGVHLQADRWRFDEGTETVTV